MADIDQDLYRACRKSKWDGDDDDAVEAGFLAASGQTALWPNMGYRNPKTRLWERPPDVTTFKSAGVTWVKGTHAGPEYSDQGVSVNLQAGVFGYEGSFYFRLPTGTPLPASLNVRQQGRRDHYVIQCVNNMTLDAFRGQLDTLAREAIAKARELRVSSLVFS